MAEFKAALAAIANLLNAFVAAGGVQTCVDLWRQQIAESRAAAQCAELDAIDRDLASGVPARIERASARLLDDSEARHRGASPGGSGGQQGRDRDSDAGDVPEDAATIESLQSEAAAIGLVD